MNNDDAISGMYGEQATGRAAAKREADLSEVPVTIDEVLDAMTRYGGSFVVALAEAWRRADSENGARLHRAFEHYFADYAKMAARDKQRRRN